MTRSCPALGIGVPYFLNHVGDERKNVLKRLLLLIPRTLASPYSIIANKPTRVSNINSESVTNLC